MVFPALKMALRAILFPGVQRLPSHIESQIDCTTFAYDGIVVHDFQG